VTVLLDVNVLIALVDPTHAAHESAHRWFDSIGRFSWATCPLTENGVVRIVSHPKYPNNPGSPAVVSTVLMQMCRLPGHVFWPDDISIRDPERIDAGRLLATGQITDLYLLALAVAHGGRLATLDRRIGPGPVRGGQDALELIPGA
jgi:toxin-antitoxin system PIN domain toxin